jgi:hypothetical protein
VSPDATVPQAADDWRSTLRAFPTIAAVLLCAAYASRAIAADRHEVMLETGQTAMLEVVKSSPDSITVNFDNGEVKGQTKLMASALDPQRSLTGQQDLLAQSGGAVAQNLVRTYKAPGGGWTAAAAETEE